MLSVSYLVKEVHILLGDSVDFPQSSADGRCTVDIKVLAGFNPSVALLLQTLLVNVECLERLAQVLVDKVLRVFDQAGSALLPEITSFNYCFEQFAVM